MSTTSLDFLPALSKQLRLNIYLKREDQLDQVGCGHKLRKLKFCLGGIKDSKATVLVTAGSMPSTQTLAVSTFARRNNLKAHIIYMGDNEVKPRHLDGPYLATCLSAPKLTWFERRPWSEVGQALNEIALIERKNGETPYIIEPGISGELGIEGSINLGKEIVQQLLVEQAEIIVPVGSGGTALGISIALESLRKNWKVYGVCIASDKTSTDKRIMQLQHKNKTNAPVTLTDDTLFDGYAQISPNWVDEARDLLNNDGILPDSTYFLKTYMSLLIKAKANYWEKNTNLVLVHTGGSPHAFSANSHLAHILGRKYSDWLS